MARIKNDVQYVFIHPSWRGGWCWDKVVAIMRAWGREAHAPDGPRPRQQIARDRERDACRLKGVCRQILSSAQ